MLWDNLGIHKETDVGMYIRARGARLEFLPAYSPDLDPLEKWLVQGPGRLRASAARTWDALEQSVGDALQAFTPNDR